MDILIYTLSTFRAYETTDHFILILILLFREVNCIPVSSDDDRKLLLRSNSLLNQSNLIFEAEKKNRHIVQICIGSIISSNFKYVMRGRTIMSSETTPQVMGSDCSCMVKHSANISESISSDSVKHKQTICLNGLLMQRNMTKGIM